MLLRILRSRWTWRAALLAYAAAIFVVSGMQMGEGPGLLPFPGGDKLLHAVEFAIFFLLARMALGRSSWAFLLTALYAGSDELHQAFVPTRDACFWDFVADLAGAAFAALIVSAFTPRSLLRRMAGRILGTPVQNRERGG